MASGIVEFQRTIAADTDDALCERHLALARLDAQAPDGDPLQLYAVEAEMRRRGMQVRLVANRDTVRAEERERRTQGKQP